MDTTHPDFELLERLRRENEHLKEELAAIRALTFEDALTGLKNRRYFDERLETEVDRATRHDVSLSVIVVDVDHFKAINDTHGHLAGDEVLRWVGRFLATTVRDHDVVCRTGGDEFMIILPNADATGASRLIARIRRRLAGAGAVGSCGRISLSMGSSTWGPECDRARVLVGAADLAMYEDKRARRRQGRLARVM